MSPLSHLCAPVSVPYRHKVSAVAAIAPVTLDLRAPLNPYGARQSQDKASPNGPRGRYNAESAAAGFAAQVLVEAGLAGSDPFVVTRCNRAYQPPQGAITTLRLVA
jgi:hypothetical protein